MFTVLKGGTKMITRTLLAGVVAILFATPALASHCPKDAAAIDSALGVVSVSAETKTQVMSLRDQGMAQHTAGDHGSAEKSLAEAMRLLLMDLK
jgi:hypothetical protein